MHYLKRNTKYSILAFLILILCITISLFPLAKTEVYFSLSDNPQKEIIKNINQAQAFINIAMYIFTDREIALPLIKAQPLLTSILQISQPLAQKIITFSFMSFPRKRESIILRDLLSGGFKDPQDLLQLSELTNLDLLEWREEGIIITVD